MVMKLELSMQIEKNRKILKAISGVSPPPWYFTRIRKESLYVVYATVGLFFLWI